MEKRTMLRLGEVKQETDGCLCLGAVEQLPLVDV